MMDIGIENEFGSGLRIEMGKGIMHGIGINIGIDTCGISTE